MVAFHVDETLIVKLLDRLDLLQDKELEQAFGRYLIAKYRSHIEDPEVSHSEASNQTVLLTSGSSENTTYLPELFAFVIDQLCVEISI